MASAETVRPSCIGPVVIAMIAMGIMQPSAHEVIDMVAMGTRLRAAPTDLYGRASLIPVTRSSRKFTKAPGDLVNDRIVVREIFAVPESVVDVRAAIDPILERMHRMAAAFSDFAGNFIRFHLRR